MTTSRSVVITSSERRSENTTTVTRKSSTVGGGKHGKSNTVPTDESWYFGTMSYFDPEFIEKKWQQRQKSKQKQKNENDHWGIWELKRRGLVFTPKDVDRYHKLIEKLHKKYGNKKDIFRGLDELIVSKPMHTGESRSRGGRKQPSRGDSVQRQKTPSKTDKNNDLNVASTEPAEPHLYVTLEDVKRVATTMLGMMLRKYQNNDNERLSASTQHQQHNELVQPPQIFEPIKLPLKLCTIIDSTQSNTLCNSLLNYFYYYRLFVTLPNALFKRKNAPGVRQELVALQQNLQIALLSLCRAFANVLLTLRESSAHNNPQHHQPVDDRFLMESYYEFLFNVLYVAFERKSGLELRDEFGRLFRSPAFNPFDTRRVMQDLRNYVEYSLQAKAMTRHMRAARADNNLKTLTNNKTLQLPARAKLTKQQADKLFLLANAGVQVPASVLAGVDTGCGVNGEMNAVEQVLQFVTKKRALLSSGKKAHRQKLPSSRLYAKRLRRRHSSLYWPMVTGARAAKSEEEIMLEKAALRRDRFKYRHSLIQDYPAMRSAWYSSPIISAMYSDTLGSVLQKQIIIRENNNATRGLPSKKRNSSSKRRKSLSARNVAKAIDELTTLPLDLKIGIIGKPIKFYYPETLLPQESDDEKAFTRLQENKNNILDALAPSNEPPPAIKSTASTPATPVAAANTSAAAAAAVQAGRSLTEAERNRERARIAELVKTICDDKYRICSVLKFYTPTEPKLPPTPHPEIDYDVVYGGNPADTTWVEKWINRPSLYPLFRRTVTEEEERLHKYFMQQQQRENAFYEQVLEYQSNSNSPTKDNNSVPTTSTVKVSE